MGLYQRGNVWWIDEYIDGKRVRETTGTKDRTEAEKIRARRLRGRSELTVNDILDDLEVEYQLANTLDPKRVVYRLRRMRERLRSYANRGRNVRCNLDVGPTSSTNSVECNGEPRSRNTTTSIHLRKTSWSDIIDTIFYSPPGTFA